MRLGRIALIWPFFAALAGAGEVDFSDDIQPILSDKCFTCHGPDEAERKADLRLDTFEGATEDLGGYAAVVPDHIDKSELVYRIDSDDPHELMPPPKSNLSLTVRERELLRAWIAEGAEYEEHWAFVPPVRPEVPEIKAETQNAIDAFIGARLEQEGLAFSTEASPERLIRRVTLDLTGLPPTVEEVDAFVKDYANRGEPAYEALVDRLLASPRYGETMALPWLDAARFADTDGYQFDGPRYQWRWRDWVIEAYNRNMPFDQFTIEQLAGDLLPEPTLEQIIATGFNRNHRYNSEAGLVVEEFLLENAVDRVDTTSTLWMGLTVGCARCHDHKYDPISQKDYYQLIAFFNSVPEAGRAIKYGNSEPVILAPTREQQAEWTKRKADLAKAKQALKPGQKRAKGEVLIDRQMVHRYPLNEVPEGGKAEGVVSFAEQALELGGESGITIPELDKALTYRSNMEFSISLWLRPDSVEDSIILSRQKPGTTRPGIEVALVDGGKVQFDLITRWVAGTGRVTSKQALKPGEWVHLTITNDGSQSADGQGIWINGERVAIEEGYNTNSNTGGVAANSPLRIGYGIRPGSAKFQGGMRDLRLFKTQLWPEEIAILGAMPSSANREEFARIVPTPAFANYQKLREDLEKFEDSLPDLMVMKEMAQPKPTYLRDRGVYNAYGELVQRDVPEKLPPMSNDLSRDRLGFAQWLVSPSHPLTARVAVNRYWQKYFGMGLVKTAEDFGVQSEAPSHPELLDWLALEFSEGGWDIAAMQKLIVTSRTYRQQSRLTPELIEKDPDNRLLARGPRQRLSGHEIRDQALYVSGLLAERIGGPSVSPYQPADLWAEMSMGMKYKQSKGEDLYRRSLYTIWKRTVAPPAMAVFDAADREACWVKKKETNTPLQALTLLNETGFVESARHLAVRMLKEGGEDPIGYGFRSVTARGPSAEQRRVLKDALAEYRNVFSEDAADAKKLISIGESPMNEEFPAPEVAAYTALANVLLNLDEVITKE